jgi:hypothetical protein
VEACIVLHTFNAFQSGTKARPLNPQPCTLHPKPYTLHLKPYTLNPSPYTLQRTS